MTEDAAAEEVGSRKPLYTTNGNINQASLSVEIIDLSYDLARPLLAVYPVDLKSPYHGDNFMSVFVPVLFITAKL